MHEALIIELLLLVLFLALSAFFSGTETAFTSLSIIQVQEMAENRGKRGKLIEHVMKRSDILLTTILVGNNLVNIAASALATQLTIILFGSRFIGLMTGILTLVVLVFSEVTPKRIAIIHNEFIALHVVRVIYALSIFFRPVIWVIGFISSFITKIFGGKQKISLSVKGIRRMLNLAEQFNILEPYENEMVTNVFRFNDVDVQSIMTHRTEIFSLDQETTVMHAFEMAGTHRYSRIPVFKKHPEHIVGIVLVKDLIRNVCKEQKNTRIKELMYKPIFVPETVKVNEMFYRFKRERLNMAVVMDEYGGVAGIVSLEDIIEEILGELYDEHEYQEGERIKPLGGGDYRIAADTSLLQVEDVLDLDIRRETEAKTISGYVLEHLGRFPRKQERLDVPGGSLVVEAVSGTKIESIRFEAEG
jgi:CBS domain containing-hemolysin-like protein